MVTGLNRAQAKLPTISDQASLTPQKSQKNHAGKHFWPNYLHTI
jgi:predicted PolB exonuclease-like 3'-5' exonuclease